jgi:hypothetical protein
MVALTSATMRLGALVYCPELLSISLKNWHHMSSANTSVADAMVLFVG